MERRQFLYSVIAGAAGLTSTAWAQTDAWPDKPVKFVLSQPPGSGPDNVARLIGDRLGKSLGQSIVIDNKPGGQNVIGAQAAARSAPDGYTFYFATTAALITNALLFKQLAYDPQKDFVPVTTAEIYPDSQINVYCINVEPQDFYFTENGLTFDTYATEADNFGSTDPDGSGPL